MTYVFLCSDWIRVGLISGDLNARKSSHPPIWFHYHAEKMDSHLPSALDLPLGYSFNTLEITLLHIHLLANIYANIYIYIYIQ